MKSFRAALLSRWTTLAGWLPLAVCGFADDSAQQVYARDMDFLLKELPQRAGRFFAMKGIDWRSVSNQFRVEVTTVSNDVQHVRLCQRLLARLKDGHARLTDLKVPLPDESGGRRWTGPGVHLLVSGERVYVRQAFGAAAARGLKIGTEVARIDDLPACEWLAQRAVMKSDDTGYSTAHQARYAACHWGLADWEGTPITFEMLDNGRTNRVRLVRSGGANFVPVGPIFPPKELKRLGRQSYGKTTNGRGYVHLRDVPGNLPEQLDTMLEALGNVPGLILDMRANGGGGCDHAAVFGRFVPAGTNWGRYPSAGRRPFTGPMVVVVDAGTRSAGETVVGMLKEDGRAYTIGDSPTAGTSSSKTTLAVPSRLFAAYFSVRSNLGRFNNGRGLEGIGVPPHEVVAYDPADLARGVDTLIRRAEELLKRGLPRNKVPFETRSSAGARD
jgi:carboxyl-terminal processing protease